jgi:hypothetical protein
VAPSQRLRPPHVRVVFPLPPRTTAPCSRGRFNGASLATALCEGVISEHLSICQSLSEPSPLCTFAAHVIARLRAYPTVAAMDVDFAAAVPPMIPLPPLAAIHCTAVALNCALPIPTKTAHGPLRRCPPLSVGPVQRHPTIAHAISPLPSPPGLCGPSLLTPYELSPYKRTLFPPHSSGLKPPVPTSAMRMGRG